MHHQQGLMQPAMLSMQQAGYAPAMAAAAAAAADAAAQQQNQQQQQEMDQKQICLVCRRMPRRVLLLPCKHLVACNACSEALEMTGSVCPLCSQPFNRRITVHGAN
jgi:uncharacterized CHY-type Zn-finger protein